MMASQRSSLCQQLDCRQWQSQLQYHPAHDALLRPPNVAGVPFNATRSSSHVVVREVYQGIGMPDGARLPGGSGGGGGAAGGLWLG